MSKFSKRLIELRNAEGLTQTELARRLDISRSTLGMYELDRRRPDIETLERLADYFNVDMDYLLGNTNKSTKLIERKELPLTGLERSLLGYFRALPDFEQGMLLGYAQRLYDENNKKGTSADAAV